MIKSTLFVCILFFAAISLDSAPPNPHTFVPNRGVGPSQLMAADMQANIGHVVRKIIYVWNRKYSEPQRQIADLLRLFEVLSDAPVVPKQMLLNSQYELYRVLDTASILKKLDRFQKDVDRTYRALFEYMSLIIGSRQGSMSHAYRMVLKEMKRMVGSYNDLAKETNRQYRRKVLPYYALNYQK